MMKYPRPIQLSLFCALLAWGSSATAQVSDDISSEVNGIESPSGRVFVEGDELTLVFGQGGGETSVLFPADIDTSERWYLSEWLGFYNDSSAPWFYHANLGWFYTETTDATEFFYYDLDTSAWIYTSSEFFPVVYDFAEKSWVFVDVDASRPGARRQLNF